MRLTSEKFIVGSLSREVARDRELVWRLIACFAPEADAEALAETLIQKRSPSVYLSEMTLDELMDIPGMTDELAFILKLLPQLIRHMALARVPARPTVRRVYEAGEYFCAFYSMIRREVCAMASLDEAGRMIALDKLSEGLVDSAPCSPRLLVETALRRHARAVILIHNHPGGTQDASKADMSCTYDCLRALSGIRVPLLDHIIIARGFVSSLRERGMIAGEEWLVSADYYPGSYYWLAQDAFQE